MKVYILDGPAIGKVVQVSDNMEYVMVAPTATRTKFSAENAHLPIDATFAYHRYRIVRREDGDAEGWLT